MNVLFKVGNSESLLHDIERMFANEVASLRFYVSSLHFASLCVVLTEYVFYLHFTAVQPYSII